MKVGDRAIVDRAIVSAAVVSPNIKQVVLPQKNLPSSESEQLLLNARYLWVQQRFRSAPAQVRYYRVLYYFKQQFSGKLKCKVAFDP